MNGYIQPPEGPGLGTDLNLEEIKKHPYNAGNWLPLFRQGWEMQKIHHLIAPASCENFGQP